MQDIPFLWQEIYLTRKMKLKLVNLTLKMKVDQEVKFFWYMFEDTENCPGNFIYHLT